MGSGASKKNPTSQELNPKDNIKNINQDPNNIHDNQNLANNNSDKNRDVKDVSATQLKGHKSDTLHSVFVENTQEQSSTMDFSITENKMFNNQSNTLESEKNQTIVDKSLLKSEKDTFETSPPIVGDDDNGDDDDDDDDADDGDDTDDADDHEVSRANGTDGKIDTSQKVKKTKKKKIKKTVEEYKELESRSLEKLQTWLIFIHENRNAEEEGEQHKILTSIKKLYFKLKGAPLSMQVEFRYKLGAVLATDGIYIGTVCDIIVCLLRGNNYQRSKEDRVSNHNYFRLSVLLSSVQNFSDGSDLFKAVYAKQEAFMKVMYVKLTEWSAARTMQKENNIWIKKMIGILHNLAMLSDNISNMKEIGFVQACAPYLDSRFPHTKLSALATLADLLSEDECDLLRTNESSVRLLLKKLDNASKSKIRRDGGWSAHELCRTVNRLARNDANKKMLVTLGCLPLLLTLTTSEINIEQEESIEAIWVLAFDEENKIKMTMEPNLIETVRSLLESTTGKVKKHCLGILWTLKETLQSMEQYKDMVTIFEKQNSEPEKQQIENKTEKVETVCEKKAGHVMISYQWNKQEVMKRVATVLRDHHFNVWMDIDDMEGSTLQAMASAVERAEVVVICMSQNYKDSPNCRAEAEYAFQLRRPIIPLIMENGYRPDGWLGFILGAKLFYDFSGKYSFESRFDGLLKGIRQIYEPCQVDNGKNKTIKEVMPLDVIDSPAIQKQNYVPVTSSRQSLTVNDDKITKWTSQDVGVWLKKHDLQENVKLEELTGMELIFLRDLKLEAPEFFYRTLETRLEFKTLKSMAIFTKAIQDLSL